MIVAEPYQRDGRTLLRDLREASVIPRGYVDTGLVAMPSGFERLEWDGQRASPLVPSVEDRLDRLDLLPPRVLRALVVRSAPSSTAEQHAAAGRVLDAALARIEEARAAVATETPKR